MTNDSATPSIESLHKVAGETISALPAQLRESAQARWRNLEPAWRTLTAINEPTRVLLAALPRVLACSDFVAQALERDPGLVTDLVQRGHLSRPYAAGELTERVRAATAAASDEADVKRALRTLRRREMVRIAWRDVARQAELGEVLANLSELADACADAALQWLTPRMHAEFGIPTGADGEPMALVVLGLGKLGGKELNFSSDIDIILAFAEEGETHGPRSLSHGEFFLRLSQSLIRVLNEPTADGFVFRVDTRLRPFGSSGPLALSFDAMEHYYQTHGREWERYALIKARASAGDRVAGEELLARLKPFVYRRYLDFGALESIRGMKELIAREVERKSMAQNIKLGPGGIREIEFIAQALQMIRGGREPVLQERATVTALSRLAQAGHLDPAVARQLSTAYTFLRRTEHCIQMLADQQTHALPADALERTRVAAAMGFADWSAFEAELRGQREAVQRHFAGLLGPAEKAPDKADAFTALWAGALDADRAIKTLHDAGYTEAERVYGLLNEMRESSSYQALSTEGRARLDRLMPLLLRETARAAEPSVTITRLINLAEAIGRRTAYFSLLIENPMALTQLVSLAAASPWIATWISQHPVLLDELLDPRGLYELPDRAQLEAELKNRLESLEADNLEAQMEALREFRHAHLLRIAAADIGPGLSVDAVGTHLSQLADVLLSASLDLSYRLLTARHGRPGGNAQHPEPGFIVVGYGKLGSQELGYASDLDMIFLYDEVEGGVTSGPRPLPNELFFARLGQRLINLLNTRTPAGILYQVDMRLRPSGNAGTLVTSLNAFTRYQQNQAWTWEHQALVRARPVAGSPALRQAFEQARRAVLCRPRDAAVLRKEVREMREKMAAVHPASEEVFDVKHDRGGIVDIEFMVQYWVLAQAHAHPEVTEPRDNIHIMEALAQRGLIPSEWAEALTDAYRRCLSTEQRLKLMERGARIPRAELGPAPDAVLKIWNQVFERE
jgi:[glutamine synthetase] adenylyltransferase / [glutamine synthetase]-adenylyl-L-tyrosine phosphorylase